MRVSCVPSRLDGWSGCGYGTAEAVPPIGSVEGEVSVAVLQLWTPVGGSEARVSLGVSFRVEGGTRGSCCGSGSGWDGY